MNQFPDHQPPRVSVIIPAHNEERYIGSCLEALKNQSCNPNLFEVIVVNNNSTDNTKEIVNSYGVTLLEKRTGLVGSVRNHGFHHSSGDLIAFLDADCVVGENWIENGIQLLDSGGDRAFGGFCLLSKNPSFIEKYWILESKTPQKDLLGAAIFIHRKDFNNVGLFDESISSGEDSKLSSSLRKKGIAISLSESISVIHLGNAKTFRQFVKRQIWHSENYIHDIRETAVDPTFYLILMWTICVLLIPIIATASVPNFYSFFCILIIILIPAIFSLKRISRSKKPLLHIKHSLYIYLIDVCYVIGRSMGLLKSVLKALNRLFKKL